jgi:glucose-6-phosphate isomerase
MSVSPFNLPVWTKLRAHAAQMSQPESHLRELLKDAQRIHALSVKGAGMFYDFSRQRLDQRILALLLELAGDCRLKEQFQAMMNGAVLNITEKRAALHTATRSFQSEPILTNGQDILPTIKSIRAQMKSFAADIHTGKLTGSTGKAFDTVVVIGIGGSYLGTEFVARALAAYADQGIALYFLANVDINDFGQLAARINPATTLWVVISKSYTTAETMANAKQVAAFVRAQDLDPADHFVTVTSQGSPGDDPAAPKLASFHMFDYIGGRYSVTSAVGGVPLSLFLGYERFEAFLKGAEEMDRHAANSPEEKNLPLIAALINVWNYYHLGYNVQGIIPYAAPLSKLAPHVQQLYMESNGKRVTIRGEVLDEPAGFVVFGEPGTNAQHSFFQLAHQGRPFPIDFIGVLRPLYEQYRNRSRGVTNHQELWANLLSQPQALAVGKDASDSARAFPGNRPSSTILLSDISPTNVGRLLAFYEARTVFEAFLIGINPFDQFGVELGKTIASGVRTAMVQKNESPEYTFQDQDPITRLYLEMLFKGKF